MKDKYQKNIINYTRKLIDKTDHKLPGRWKYDWLYRYTGKVLNADFKKADKIFIPTSLPKTNVKIPYKFWIMWWQGINSNTIPTIVKKSIRNSQNVFGKKNVIIITKNNYKNYTNISDKLIDKLKKGKISFTAWSDIVRFNILSLHGGYWIDSTVMVSPIFNNFIQGKQNNSFITLNEKTPDYHNISFSKWTIWFIGGIAHYNLFEYINMFYNIYFDSHELIMDYFLTDDIIAHYYKIHSDFQKECKNFERNWQPYYWAQNFTKNYNREIISKFYDKLEYSVQKLTYKFPPEALKESNTLATYLIINWNVLN